MWLYDSLPLSKSVLAAASLELITKLFIKHEVQLFLLFGRLRLLLLSRLILKNSAYIIEASTIVMWFSTGGHVYIAQRYQCYRGYTLIVNT